uniref:Uncharacterized protein n=1 Tax=viral metagenome TaxID=1070528 RepID=A0A6H1ZFR9_9ZZZZ
MRRENETHPFFRNDKPEDFVKINCRVCGIVFPGRRDEPDICPGCEYEEEMSVDRGDPPLI